MVDVATPADSRTAALWISLGLIVIVLVPYAQVGGHEFVHWDDDAYVFDNPIVRQGLTLHGLRWATTAVAVSNWHPLTWWSHMLDVELFGMDPAGHHLMSVALHALNAVLLFLALRRLTGGFWPSALVAALFAVHPLRVESVAWVSERKDVLSGLFWMLALLAYAGYARRESLGRYLLVFAAMALGLMAKPMLVTLPCVLLLIDIWPLGRWRIAGWERPDTPGISPRPVGRLFLEKLPLLGLAAASGAVTIIAQRSGGALGALEHLPLIPRLTNALVAWVGYLWMTVWPTALACFYPHPGVVAPWTLGAVVALGGISYLIVRSAPRRPYLLVGWLWYVGMLVPVIGIFQVGLQSMADRYTYLPMIGVYVVAVWGGIDLRRRWPRRRAFLDVAALLLLLAFVVATWSQIRTWRNSQTLFENALRVTGSNFVMHNNLGNVFLRQGDLDRAAEQYALALRLRPDYAKAANNLGLALERQGKLEQAAARYREAIEDDPGYAEAHRNLASILAKQGKTSQAVAGYERAIELRPDDVEAHNNLGALLERMGHLERARNHLERALRVDPQSAEASNNLGLVLRRQGELEQARARFELAVRLNPAYAAAYNNLGTVLDRLGRASEAVARYEEALRLEPRFSEAHNNLGIVYAKQGDLTRAASHFEQALVIDPTNTTARQNLARARSMMQQQ